MIIISFLPILVFIFFYFGSGLYFLIQGIPFAFYQVSPITCVIIGFFSALFIVKDRKKLMADLLEGASNKDIVIMCLIFIFSGIFSQVTKSIGCIDTIVNIAFTYCPSSVIIIGIFLVSSLISTAIGTSMGTISAVGPIAYSLSSTGYIDGALIMGSVVGGAIFGDNLSLISDTTIASVAGVSADTSKKLKINFKIALIASFITILILFYISCNGGVINLSSRFFSLGLIVPYLLLIIMPLFNINIFYVLLISIFFSFGMGFFYFDYSFIQFNKDILTGINSMFDITVLSLFIGGLSSVVYNDFKSEFNIQANKYYDKCIKNNVLYKLIIIFLVSFFDILFANNTVAIIFTAKIIKDSIEKNKDVSRNLVAVILDIFSCVFQGIIPWGAQILLASNIAKISPFVIIGRVYYCYILFFVALVYCFLYNE